MPDKRPKILCVDDEPVNLALLEALLEPRGYTVIRCDSGGDALSRISEQKVDLVLLDVMMPGLDGFAVCSAIKENELYRHIPVVMITALTSKQDRIRGIEAGAEDFISKPIDPSEVVARVRMLLQIKDLDDRLASAYRTVTSMINFGEAMILSFDPLQFDFLPRIDDIVKHILKGRNGIAENPEFVFVGFIDDNRIWQWYQFDSIPYELHRTWLKSEFSRYVPVASDEPARTAFYNRTGIGQTPYGPFLQALRARSIAVSNMACFVSSTFCIFAVNYGKVVSQYDAEILNSLVMQSLYLKSLASQVRETENAFDYLVFSLARAAEANDEDTGNHILRVGEYCALLARELGMSDKFSGIMRIQATLHDVGKIHIDPRILKKPGELTPQEFDDIRKHTLYGAKILGDHVRLTLARKACLSHHERWDGSGYPHGLKGDQIPIEGRILNIADQYDALRNARVYKPSYDHRTSFQILAEGDGRTMPHHFDPQVLAAFKKTAAQFEKIYEKMEG